MDDGIASRGHRKNALESKFKFIGIGIAAHEEFGVVIVIDYGA